MHDDDRISRNTKIHGHRTCLRLEATFWELVDQICVREGWTLSQFCEHVKEADMLADCPSASLSSAIRVFVVTYFRDAATEVGHRRAGHGKRYLTFSSADQDRRAAA